MIETPKIEFESLENIRKFQENKLQETLQYLQRNSPFYQKLFKREKINIDAIKTIEDLAQISFTEKMTYNSTMQIFFVFLKKRSSIILPLLEH